jgi:hypothetical protein
MTLRTYSSYTHQQVAEFARSYRKTESAEFEQKILLSNLNLSPEDRKLFLSSIMETFDMGSPIPGYELLLFLWPTGEAAFLAVGSDSFHPIVDEQHGRAHWYLSSPNTIALGLPDTEVVNLYRLRAGLSLGGWLVWDGIQLEYHPSEEADALELRNGGLRNVS